MKNNYLILEINSNCSSFNSSGQSTFISNIWSPMVPLLSLKNPFYFK